MVAPAADERSRSPGGGGLKGLHGEQPADRIHMVAQVAHLWYGPTGAMFTLAAIGRSLCWAGCGLQVAQCSRDTRRLRTLGARVILQGNDGGDEKDMNDKTLSG